jgi:hypothetical protein
LTAIKIQSQSGADGGTLEIVLSKCCLHGRRLAVRE